MTKTSKTPSWFKKAMDKFRKKRALVPRDDQGRPLRVLRPKDPALARKTVRDIQARSASGELAPTGADPAFTSILTAQPHRYMGIVGPEATIVDEQGTVIGCLVPGDSFVTEDDLAAIWVDNAPPATPDA